MNDEDSAQKWKPASIEEVKEILKENLAGCDREQKAAFDRDAVEPYFASIVRYGKLDSVIVVARRNNEVILLGRCRMRIQCLASR